MDADGGKRVVECATIQLLHRMLGQSSSSVQVRNPTFYKKPDNKRQQELAVRLFYVQRFFGDESGERKVYVMIRHPQRNSVCAQRRHQTLALSRHCRHFKLFLRNNGDEMTSISMLYVA